jgi:ATP-dependent RNA helicase DeaD
VPPPTRETIASRPDPSAAPASAPVSVISPELPAPIAPPPLVTRRDDEDTGPRSREIAPRPRKPERRQRAETEGPTVPPEPPRVRRVADPTPTLRDANAPGGRDAPVAKTEGDSADTEADGQNPDAAEVFVNVGRKDGAKASDFYAVLEKQSGITIDDTDYVNVRQRHTFIGIRRELVQRALDALNGATIAGREASAEPSRSRP